MSDDKNKQLLRELDVLMQSIAASVKARLNQVMPNVGFSLVVWGPGRSLYISNCSRVQAQEGLENLLDRWRANAERPDVPYAGVGEFMDPDHELIQTPNGSVRWGTIRKALEQQKD